MKNFTKFILFALAVHIICIAIAVVFLKPSNPPQEPRWFYRDTILINKHSYHVNADSITISGDTIYLKDRKQYIIVK